MNKKIIIAISGLFILILICTGIWLYNSIAYYTVALPDKDSVVKIVYQYCNGDLYEITDETIIDEFINSIDGMKFKKESDMTSSTWSSSVVYFLDDEETLITSIQVYGANSIIHENNKYISDKEYKLDVLENVGTYIKNIYVDKE